MRAWCALLIVLSVLSCARISEVTVLRPAAPRTELPAIRVAPQSSPGWLLFEMKVTTEKEGGLPDADLMAEVRKRGAQLGANVLVFECGRAGTLGQDRCNVQGFYE